MKQQSPFLKKQVLRQPKEILFTNKGQEQNQNTLYFAINKEKHLELSLKRQTINNEAVEEIDTPPPKIYFNQLLQAWQQLQLSAQERSYIAYQLAVDSQAISQYLKLSQRLIQSKNLGLEALSALKQINFTENLQESFAQFQFYLLTYLSNLNTFRTISQQTIDFDYNIKNIFDEIYPLLPEVDIIIQIMTSLGYNQQVAEKQLTEYQNLLQTTFSIPQTTLLLFLSAETKQTKFPQNFSQWVHRMTSQQQHEFAPQAYNFFIAEKQNCAAFEQIKQAFQEENFTISTIPVRSQKTIFDVFNTKTQYASQKLQEKLNEVVEIKSNSRMTSKLFVQRETTFSATISKKNALQSILNYKDFQSDYSGQVNELKSFYSQLKINEIEQKALNQLCGKHENLHVLFIKNARKMLNIMDEYKMNFMQLRQFVDKEIINETVIDLINRQFGLLYQAREIANKPIQLPALNIGTDFIILYYNKIKNQFTQEQANMINQKYIQQAQSENDTMVKFIQDYDSIKSKGFEIFTLKFDLNDYDIYKNK